MKNIQVLNLGAFIPRVFDTEQVEALLAETKTQDRRMDGLEIINEYADKYKPDGSIVHNGKRRFKFLFPNTNDIFDGIVIACSYQVRDVIWVQEAFCYAGDNHVEDGRENKGLIIYKASEDGKLFEKNYDNWKWRSPQDMPGDAARIFLFIKEVRPERLNSISHEDSKAEGVYRQPHRCPGFNPEWQTERENSICPNESSGISDCYRCSFVYQWRRLYGKDGYLSWNNDNFVWRIKFKRIATPDTFLNTLTTTK